MPAPRGTGADGIQVHGWWTIEVGDPAKGPVIHREFENALTGFGAQLLVSALLREQTLGRWSITFTGISCPDEFFVSQQCEIVESVFPNPDVLFQFPTLTSSLNNGGVLLKGNISGQAESANGQISEVHTNNWPCPADVAPASCPYSGNSTEFTGTTLSAPIPVEAGQPVSVSVRITFQ